MGTTLAEALNMCVRHWMNANKTGVFLGGSAISSFTDINGAEVYTSMRSFQTRLLTRTAELFLRTSCRDERTSQILVAVADISMVDTPSLKRSAGDDIYEQMKPIMWDPEEYTRLVLHRVLDLGHSYVLEGWGWRLVRAFSSFVSPSFGDPTQSSVAEWRDLALK